MAALGALLLFLGVAAWAWRQHEERERELERIHAEQIARARGGFRLTTAPEGASVTADDTTTFKTPAVFEKMKLGRHQLRIELDRYETVYRTAVVRENQVADLGWVAMTRQKGTLQIDTRPAGAIFEVSGEESFNQSGMTPATFTNLPTGTYHVLLKRAGWLPRKEDARVDRNATASISWEFGLASQLTDTMRRQMEMRGKALVTSGNFDGAADVYQELIAAEPTNHLAFSNLGVVQLNQGKLEEAEVSLKSALGLNPKDTYTLSMLGITQSRQGKYEESIKSLGSVAEQEVTNPEAHHHLGVAYLKHGFVEAAEKEFLKVLALKPEYAETHFNLAMIYSHEKPPSMELARRHYQKALELGVQRDDDLDKLLSK